MIVATLPVTAQAEAYRLGVMDKLRIRIAEWQTAEGAVRDWSVISGDYVIGPSGTVSLPLIGDMSATGKTSEEVAKEIGTLLQGRLGLRDLPSASVELAQYRPIFLAGDVQTPGEYAYTPNLTVLKAVSLGGGLRRSETGQRFARDFISAKGDSAVDLAERNRLLARRARLQAEISGAANVPMPAELKDVPMAARPLENEAALLVSRDKKLKRQLLALDDLKSLLQNEIDALAQKSETQKRQLELAREDLTRVERLTEKGLALSSKMLSIEQRTADLESAILDIDTASLKAKQDFSKATQDALSLTSDREAEIVGELQDTEAELQVLALKIATSGELMSEALVQSADSARRDDQTAALSYAIVREQDGKPKEIPADENMALLPGDVVKVKAGLFSQ